MIIAVIKTGGKQYKVKEGDVIDVEKMSSKNKSVDFNDLLSGKKVKATLMEELKGPKVRIFKYKNKTGYKRSKGHRQIYSKIKIEKIA